MMEEVVEVVEVEEVAVVVQILHTDEAEAEEEEEAVVAAVPMLHLEEVEGEEAEEAEAPAHHAFLSQPYHSRVSQVLLEDRANVYACRIGTSTSAPLKAAGINPPFGS